MPPTQDIEGRPEIIQLVDHFYQRVRADDTLGFIFNDVVAVVWETHLPKMYAFWQTVLFRDGGYKGDPIAAHAKILAKTPIGKEQFDRWLTLFEGSVDELFDGPNAGHIKRCAQDMANVINGKINNIPDPRFDPANLTPEQRARYATYKENG
jgi:hemoglobin